ncbi:hypothetical protein B0H67DRAFT_150825 [Lasiosphaeris hirsuta]|uniref:Uncharacterized protein n=1 Tax=Lasiosphaeris hirsuta TaxID=260670 RepID=A0AA40AP27_9PEZI|nr:hypothetical protein B0H67DRAFT_150825 [Lasiosphaeris hirsuta]
MAVFGPLDTHSLMLKGLIGPVDPDGFRRIQKRRVLPWGEQYYSHISLDVKFHDPGAESSFVAVPAHFVSPATLQYVGLDEKTAVEAYQAWCGLPPQTFVTSEPGGGDLTKRFWRFMTWFMMRRRVDGDDGSSDEEQRWHYYLSEYGVSQELQAIMMSPGHSEIRKGKSCIIFVVESMQTRYQGLVLIHAQSSKRENELEKAVISEISQAHFRQALFKQAPAEQY